MALRYPRLRIEIIRNGAEVGNFLEINPTDYLTQIDLGRFSYLQELRSTLATKQARLIVINERVVILANMIATIEATPGFNLSLPTYGLASDVYHNYIDYTEELEDLIGPIGNTGEKQEVEDIIEELNGVVVGSQRITDGEIQNTEEEFVALQKRRLMINIYLQTKTTVKNSIIVNNSETITYDEKITETLIPYNDANLTIKSFDRSCIASQEYTGCYLNTLLTGSATIVAYYVYSDQNVHQTQEVIVYDNFFKDNYDLIIGEFDRINLQSNYQMKAIFDTCMEFFDILWAYENDIKTVRDPIKVKYKFLKNLGLSMGMGYQDYNVEGTPAEIFAVHMYRELINNLIDLIEIRGTKLSYELFFGALGYDIDILEYWFNEDGNLIEINYEDDSISTFYAYTEDGLPLEENQKAYVDPRGKTSYTNDYNYCSKSPYIRIRFSRKSGYESIVSYTGEQRILLQKYLEYLKPRHLIYLDEILSINISNSGEELYELVETANPASSVRLDMCANYGSTYEGAFSTAISSGWNNKNNSLVDDANFASTDINANSFSTELQLSNAIVNQIIEGYIHKTYIHVFSETTNKNDVNLWMKLSFTPITKVKVSQALCTITSYNPTLQLIEGASVNIDIILDSISISIIANDLNVLLDEVLTVNLSIATITIKAMDIRPEWDNIIPVTKWELSGDSLKSIDITSYVEDWVWDDIRRISVSFKAENLSNLNYSNETNIRYIGFGFAYTTTEEYPRICYTSPPSTLPHQPGEPNFEDTIYSGTFLGYGGQIVESFVNLSDLFILSTPIVISDIFASYIKYDSGLYYDGYAKTESGNLQPEQPTDSEKIAYPPIEWKDIPSTDYELPSGTKPLSELGADEELQRGDLFYDEGVMLSEVNIRGVNITSFGIEYTNLQSSGYTESVIKSTMLADPDYNHLTSTQYETIKNLF